MCAASHLMMYRYVTSEEWMVADETRFAETNRVNAVSEPIEKVTKGKSEVNSVMDIPNVTFLYKRLIAHVEYFRED